MYIKTLIVLLLSLSCSSLATATESNVPTPSYSKDVTAQLVRTQVKLTTVQEMVEKDEITEAQAKTTTSRLLEEARSTVGDKITLEQINTLTGSINTSQQPLTWLQKVAGLVTFVNIMWMLAILVGIACFLVLAGSYLSRLPKELYEFIGYAGSIALIFWGNTLGAGVAEYVTFTGSLMFVGLTLVTVHVHTMNVNETLHAAAITCFLAVSAIVTHNPITGFATSIALMTTLGFSALVIYCGYAVGFTDENALARATSAGFILLTLYVIMTATGLHSNELDLFRGGALWMGSFVGFLGLLIASSRWYKNRRNYVIMQVITICAGIAALFFGSVFGIAELQKIGGTFFALYIVEKFTEIPAESTEGYAAVGLSAAGVLWGMSWFIKSHADQLAPYVFGF